MFMCGWENPSKTRERCVETSLSSGERLMKQWERKCSENNGKEPDEMRFRLPEDLFWSPHKLMHKHIPSFSFPTQQKTKKHELPMREPVSLSLCLLLLTVCAMNPVMPEHERAFRLVNGWVNEAPGVFMLHGKVRRRRMAGMNHWGSRLAYFLSSVKGTLDRCVVLCLPCLPSQWWLHAERLYRRVRVSERK